MTNIGFHYFPDTDHYRKRDLETWLPRLKELKASWLTMRAPLQRAIPEHFLKELLKADVQPVLHFHLRPDQLPPQEGLKLFFDTYARWGVKYVILFDRPNLRAEWGSISWAQSDLVERFLDLYLPIAEEAVRSGLKPVFPPLAPGGDYWDTMFLRAGLAGLQRRGSQPLLDSLLLSAYAGANDHDLNWGSGGPERWPEAHPYITPEGGQDHRGFRIVDWYLALSETILERRLPVIMLGLQGSGDAEGEDEPQEVHMAALLMGRSVAGLEPLPEEVLGGMFWLLAADVDNEYAEDAWYVPDGQGSPVVEAYQRLFSSPTGKTGDGYRFDHYLLLPTYEWGVADWHLEVIRGFVKKHRPTVGFSLREAAYAKRITILGGEEHFREEDLAQLRNNGSVVRRITGDGTKVAAQLAAL
ncbi:MAG: hypothetical protein R6U57_05270 [Anaerolineales bacterium]